jgi:hypothetical protein
VYVRSDQAEALKKEAKSKDVGKDEAKTKGKPSDDSLKLSDQTKEQLNKTVEDLRKVAPGAKGKVRGTVVERHGDGKRFKISGVVAHGFKAAALMVAGVEKISAGAANLGTGSLEGGRELAASPASKDVEKLGKKTLSAAAKVKEIIKKKK